MFFYVGAACAITLGLWGWLGDADFSTLLAYHLFRSRWEKYRGKVVWITGASSGIGEQIAYVFARLGCKIVLSGTRQEELERVRNRCETISQQCQTLIVRGNITDLEQHPTWVKTVLDTFGTIDVLVNNAGRSQRAQFEQIPIQLEKELFDVNVFGMISLTREIVKLWIDSDKRNGEILVTSSTAGKMGAPMSATYTASKHALQGYFESLRSEMHCNGRPLNITIACPGPVRSNIRVTAYTAKAGEQFNMPDTNEQKLLDTKRCAHLMVAGLASGLDELWIAHQPILFSYYLAQYLPSVFRSYILPLIMKKSYMMKLRNGK